MKGLTIGRVVHYVLPDKQHRPAMVVRVHDQESGLINVTVFTDWSNDGKFFDTRGIVHAQCVEHDPTGEKIRTWHWPEKE
jgi:hypothetical protein